MIDTQHYLYEVYAAKIGDQKAAWLVRYVMFPEGNEGYREIEQLYLFAQDLTKKPTAIRLDKVTVEAEAITWNGRTFTLVDRRDLTTRHQ